MELKLFSREYIHTDLSYEEHLKLKSFLEGFFSKETVALLLEMFSLYGNDSEIYRRQEFFKAVTENKEHREFLKTIRNLFRSVETAALLYQKAEGVPDKYIWGVNILAQYVQFIKEVTDEKKELSSEIFRELNKSIETIRYSEEFEKLCMELDGIETHFSVIREMNVYGDYMGAAALYYGFAPGKKENIQDTIDRYLSEMGIEIGLKENIARANDTDLYKRYVSYIVSKYPDMVELFRRTNTTFADLIQKIISLDIRDIQIGLACCELYYFLKEKGIRLCYPEISSDGEMFMQDMYDISLLTQKEHIVPNSVTLGADEKTVFVSGANGGGKTAFIRAMGICNVMFSCGLFIPAVSGRLSVSDNIFTVFPHKEQLVQEGRFVTEKGFLEEATEKATGESLILANELFSTTGENMAFKQYQAFVDKLEEKKVRVVFVTHFTSVVKFFGDAGYPLYACKMEDDTVTFCIERTGAHTSSVSMILKKYRLQKSQLKERLVEK